MAPCVARTFLLSVYPRDDRAVCDAKMGKKFKVSKGDSIVNFITIQSPFYSSIPLMVKYKI